MYVVRTYVVAWLAVKITDYDQQKQYQLPILSPPIFLFSNSYLLFFSYFIVGKVY